MFSTDASNIVHFSTAVPLPSTTGGAESENASCTTHITLSCELEHMMRSNAPSDMDDQLSLNPSLDGFSSDATAMPECASTQCNTPTNAPATAAAAVADSTHRHAGQLPPLRNIASFSGCTELLLPQLYKRAGEDPNLRAVIAVNAKQLFHTLTGFYADDVLDLLFVRETWFSTEVLIHGLCLINRLAVRYPRWCAFHIDSDTDTTSSYADSPVRGSGGTGNSNGLPHICSSTSSDISHLDSMDDAAMVEAFTELARRPLRRSGSTSTSSLGDIFTPSNSQRCFIAVLLLSSKFHGDIVYNTQSLATAVSTYCDDQKKKKAMWPLASAEPRRKPLLRMSAGSLGQCEQRLFRDLGCSVFVHREEYQCCEQVILSGLL